MNNETDIKVQFGYFKFKDLTRVLTSYTRTELKSGIIIQISDVVKTFCFQFII